MIEIRNLTETSVDKEILKKAAQKVLKEEYKKTPIYNLSVVLVKKKTIRELNKKYRGENKLTDILSFSAKSHTKQKFILPEEIERKNNLGEIIICPRVVKKNAEKFNLTFKKELTKILIHGVLHLLGYNHKKSKKEAELMKKKEEYYLSQF